MVHFYKFHIPQNCHCQMVASKWLVDVGEDESTSHEEWLNATNLDSSELSLLERNFIDAMVSFFAIISFSYFSNYSLFGYFFSRTGI